MKYRCKVSIVGCDANDLAMLEEHFICWQMFARKSEGVPLEYANRFPLLLPTAVDSTTAKCIEVR